MKPEEYELFLSETDKMIDRLHALYEQWFQGLERREPAKQREIVHKRLESMRTNMPRNTALRFRTQGLIARWVTLTHHWNKISRQIEEGTYKRDVIRAKRKADERAQREKLLASRHAAAASATDLSRADADPRNHGWDLDDFDDIDVAVDSALEPIRPALADADEGAAAVVVPRFAAVTSRGGAPSPSPAEAPAAPARPAPPARPAAPARPAPPAAPTSPTPPTRLSPPAPPSPPKPVVPPAAARPAPPPPPSAPKPVAAAARAAARAPEPTPAAAPRAAPSASAAGPDLHGLFDKYVAAKKLNQERTDNVRFEALASSIEKMLPDLQKKHAGKKIDFEVVVKDGRVGLKPVPK